MSISVSSQAYVFLYSILGGMAIAFIYDIFRIKRKRVKTRSIVLHLEDFLYWIIVSLVMFASVYYSNEGEIRGFIFIGTILGVIFYALAFSRIVMKVSLKVIDITIKCVKTIWLILSYPFKIIFKILSIPIRFIFKLLGKYMRKARRASRSKAAKLALWGRMIKHRRKKI
ncbi:MAG: spore cortex biosynthesis protein YabQ [Clostridia bacterium]|nr:spore cortex biosynthesis protein YabQ [Clostridia bacterium]